MGLNQTEPKWAVNEIKQGLNGCNGKETHTPISQKDYTKYVRHHQTLRDFSRFLQHCKMGNFVMWKFLVRYTDAK